MLLIDFSGTLYSSILGLIYSKHFEVNDDLIRHTVLQTLRKYKKKFPQYGQVVIACDSKNYWRKSIFPYYKSTRKIQQDGDKKLNWKEIHDLMRLIKEELKVVLPYIIIEIEGAEADDVIAHLSVTANENCMIVSRDHDLVQLQRYRKNVWQYNPIDDRMETSDNLNKFLFEHICKGDRGDGIPNIASPANSFVVGTRQTPITQKKIDVWFDEKNIPKEYQERFSTNRKLIDLMTIPSEIKNKIEESYQAQINKKVEMRHLMKYLHSHDLHELSNLIGDFF